MGILQTKKTATDAKTVDFSLAKSRNLLLIFTRNPELGKVKTRLAAKVGDEAALAIYKFLLDHTLAITKGLYAKKTVYYSEEIWEHDIWDNTIFDKKLQEGKDLGARMGHAFQQGFHNGFEKIAIIGSDMFDLSQEDLESAFIALDKSDFVVGPAEDGGYYLLGMKRFMPQLFQAKGWGTATVLEDTLSNLAAEKTALLKPKNDIDRYEDIQNIEAFAPFLKHIKNP